MQSKITILLFGQLAEQAGVNQLDWEDLPTTDAVLKKLATLYPILEHNHYQVALDKELIHESKSLLGHHVIALLPPYAGG